MYVSLMWHIHVKTREFTSYWLGKMNKINVKLIWICLRCVLVVDSIGTNISLVLYSYWSTIDGASHMSYMAFRWALNLSEIWHKHSNCVNFSHKMHRYVCELLVTDCVSCDEYSHEVIFMISLWNFTKWWWNTPSHWNVRIARCVNHAITWMLYDFMCLEWCGGKKCQFCQSE